MGVLAFLVKIKQNWNAKKFFEYLKKFGLGAKKKVKELSRGMKVKLQIAAVLSHDAKLLILDEPTSGLYPVARDKICDLLREFATDEGRSVLFSTHITTDLEKTADYTTFILDGHIVFSGAIDMPTRKRNLRIITAMGCCSTTFRGFTVMRNSVISFAMAVIRNSPCRMLLKVSPDCWQRNSAEEK